MYEDYVGGDCALFGQPESFIFASIVDSVVVPSPTIPLLLLLLLLLLLSPPLTLLSTTATH